MSDVTVPDIQDDLSELTLAQARLMTALDDAPVLPPGPPRIVVVVDATTSMGEYLPSRRVTLEAARQTVRAMFKATPQLEMQVVYFRGDECGASRWFTDPEQAARTIAGIEHRPGWTQHGRAFRHIISEAKKQPIHAVVVLTDAVELRGRGNPNGDDLEDLCKDAMRLRRLGCAVTFAYKGSIPNGCPIDRAGPHAEERIREIATDNGGCVFVYNPADPKLANRFGEIATQAALAAKGDAVGAQKVLEHIRTVPFEMNVGEQVVPTRKCER